MITVEQYYKENFESDVRLFNHQSNPDDYNIGPVYHGGGWNGVNAPLVRDGSLGTGVYFTDDKKRALSYTESDWKEVQGAKAGKSQYLVEARIKMIKPVVIPQESKWPEYQALVILGMKPERADNTISRAQERTGNTGSCIRKLGESKGYDGIIRHTSGDMEYVIWYPYHVMVTNVIKL